eukprot:5213217-Prymnesium_polylepis.2
MLTSPELSQRTLRSLRVRNTSSSCAASSKAFASPYLGREWTHGAPDKECSNSRAERSMPTMRSMFSAALFIILVLSKRLAQQPCSEAKCLSRSRCDGWEFSSDQNLRLSAMPAKASAFDAKASASDASRISSTGSRSAVSRGSS